ncbi:kinase-like protein [Stereum hirsutum FP-91666 SS1]|uniref:Kinase-like protein n=1 Tax=Stereum hirsutum (strain FP-91666) TaxID=721885 RepID=R7RWP9_STEHR|nr:kinase-like protein [Stereum hirsutum FP-91666 SS1]EIM79801.1 kinase-like protein [Stereum hirsutum FP-91666 SS1]
MLIALIIEIYVAIRSWYDRSWHRRNKGRIKRLPFSLVLKIGMDNVASESATVRFVRSNTTIPIPHVIASDSAFGKTYMLMRRVDGISLEFAWHDLDTRQRANVVEQLRSFVTQLRTLSPALSRGHGVGAVCALNNAPLFDSRITSVAPIGPFPNERAFNDYLITVAEPYMDETTLPAIRARMRDDHHICFTHGDLAPRNIFVQGDTVTAIIDWEEAGWYPEHWEIVKALWCTLKDPEWLRAVRHIVAGDLEREWMLDRELTDHMVGAF